jgi:hypothetical protein
VRRPVGDGAVGVGPGRRGSVGDRGPIRAGQGRLRPGRVRGAWLGRVVPARHPEPVRPGGADGHPGAGNAADEGQKKGSRLIPLTVPEVRKLLLRMVWDRLTLPERTLAWSEWRRAHQHRARVCHYRKRRAWPPDG